MKRTQKILAMLLSIVMCLSFFPVSTAWAEEAEQEETAAEEVFAEEGEPAPEETLAEEEEPEAGEPADLAEEALEPADEDSQEIISDEAENAEPDGDDALNPEGVEPAGEAENAEEQLVEAMSAENRGSPGTDFADEEGLRNCLEAWGPEEWPFLNYTGEGPMTFTEDIDLRGYKFSVDYMGHDVIIPEGVSVAIGGSNSGIQELTVNGQLLSTGDFYPDHLSFGPEGEIILRGTLRSYFEDDALDHINLSWEDGGQPTLYWKLQITDEETLRQKMDVVEGRMNVVCYADIVGDLVLTGDLLFPFNWVVTVRGATLTVPAGCRLTMSGLGLDLDGGHLAIDGTVDTMDPESRIYLNNYNADCSIYSPGGNGKIGRKVCVIVCTEEDSTDRFFYGFPMEDYIFEDRRAEYLDWRISPYSDLLYFSDPAELTTILNSWDWNTCEKEAVYDGNEPLYLGESIQLPGSALKIDLQGRDLYVSRDAAVSGLYASSVGQVFMDGNLEVVSMDGFGDIFINGSMHVDGILNGNGNIIVFGTLSFGENGRYRGKDCVIRLHRSGSGDQRSIAEFLPGMRLQNFVATPMADGWELRLGTGHWIELLGLDDYNPPEDPNLTGTRARVKVWYNLDRSDTVHTSTPRHLLQVFLSTDPNFYKTREGLNRADVKAQMMGMPEPVEEFPNTEVFYLTELVPNTTYYYTAHLVDPMTTDTLAIAPTDDIMSFTTGAFGGSVISHVGETAAGEIICITPEENGVYSLTIPEEVRIARGTIRVRDANSGSVIAEDVKNSRDEPDLFSVFLAEAGRTYYVYAQGFEEDDSMPDGVGRNAIYFPVTLSNAADAVPLRVPANGTVQSQGSRAVCLEAWNDTACEYTVTGISSMGNLAVANLNTLTWDIYQGNLAKFVLQPGEQIFLKWNGNPTKPVEFTATDEAHDVMALIRAVNPDDPAVNVRAAMQAIYQADPDNLIRMMQINDPGVIGTILEREEKAAGGSTVVFVTPAGREMFAEVKVLGAGLNNTPDNKPARLVVDKAQHEHTVPVEARYKTLQFSLTLDNIIGGSSELAFPITVDLRLNQTGVDKNELVFYHFHGDTNEYDEIKPNVYIDVDTGYWYAKLTLTGLSDFALAYMPGGSGSSADGEDASAPVRGLSLDHDYLAMKPGDTAEIKAQVPDGSTPAGLTWSVEAVEGGENVITVDDPGLVTAANPGAAFVVASAVWGDGTSTIARCRVDVISRTSEVESFRLLNSKATVELYKTDYTRIQIIPELEQNLSPAAVKPAVVPLPEPEADSGVTITGAQFQNPATAERFGLRVVDDRTLEIIPNPAYVTTDAATLKALKSSYKSCIEITLAGQDEPVLSSAPLTLTVKKTVPKLAAKALKLNSFYDETKQLVFTGSTPQTVWPDPGKDQPVWLRFNSDEQEVTYSGEPNAKKSGKLYLQAKVEGWALQLPVTVSVSVAKSAPKLKLKPASVNLQHGVGDVAESVLTITPAVFADHDRYPIAISIYEGKTLLTNGEELAAAFSGQTVYVGEGSNAPEDGKLHTYKVNLSIRGEKPVTLTVKRLAAKTAASLTVKTSGAIDLAVPDSPLTLKPTLKNTGSPASSFAVTGIKNAAGNDCLNLFRVNGLTLTAAEGLEPGKYTATVTAEYGLGGTVSKNVTFTVKRSTRIPAAGVTLKSFGSIDVIRPWTTSVTVTPTVKNFYSYALEDARFTITARQKIGKKWVEVEDYDSQFDWEVRNGKILVRANTDDGIRTDWQYYLVLSNLYDREGNPVKDAKGKDLTAQVKLSVKMGSAKVTQSTKTVQLLKDDRFSRGLVVLGTNDASLSPIDWEKTAAAFVSTKDKSGNPFFTLLPLENGECAVCYAGSEMNPAVKSGTVKIRVFFTGNVSGKPNATLSVKVNIK